MSKVRSGPLTPCPSPSRGEGSFFIRMRSAPPLPFRERGLGGEGCPATTRLCTCPEEGALVLDKAPAGGYNSTAIELLLRIPTNDDRAI